MLEEINGVMTTLIAPTVDGSSPEGTLDPQSLPERTAVRLASYIGMKFNDEVHLYFTPDGASRVLIDKIKIRANQGETPPWFSVLSDEFAKHLGSVIGVSYEVWFGNQRLHTSRELQLEIKTGFEGEHTLDLQTYNYVVVTGKPPLTSPAFSRFTREATWGVAPYEYTSSDTTVASVERQGEVTATGNGICTLRATDSVGQAKSYNLTVTGIGQLHFLTATANWSGMRNACTAAGLEPATLAQLRQLMSIYSANAGSLTDYFELLPYPFWTGELNGANTAWIVDLDKRENDPLDPHFTSADLSELHQVLGISIR
ncbi:hypothetical protein LOY38_12500 [Pseudomonas sp. B21-015]|uniref:hypothetical protein n=1 Tax=Pseudomonas sp. B21-015 TaxID=2895473 RepID=UPI00215E6E36|nr:hypothetical protein [Pseudomonas sp. B21-015]UVM52781.1 hypothetical protein LOY38_12500 [Pseudomonas sp. B21-015]